MYSKNTVTSSRTLVKPRKGLDVTERFARSCFEKFLKKADLKISTKNSPKGNYYEVLSSVTSKPASSLKKPP